VKLYFLVLKLTVAVMWALKYVGTLALLCFQCLLSASSAIVPLKVGIIGAGAGGSSAAHFLSKLLGANVEIDVFDEKSIVGGRLATANILGAYLL
jgi:hypothetical protein